MMAALLQIEHCRLVRQSQWLAEVLARLLLVQPARLSEVHESCAIPVARSGISLDRSHADRPEHIAGNASAR